MPFLSIILIIKLSIIIWHFKCPYFSLLHLVSIACKVPQPVCGYLLSFLYVLLLFHRLNWVCRFLFSYLALNIFQAFSFTLFSIYFELKAGWFQAHCFMSRRLGVYELRDFGHKMGKMYGKTPSKHLPLSTKATKACNKMRREKLKMHKLSYKFNNIHKCIMLPPALPSNVAATTTVHVQVCICCCCCCCCSMF